MTRAPVDPYRAVIEQFNRRGVHYVVVGMSGVNYYVKHAVDVFATIDYDVFLEPTLSNVSKALAGLRHLGFTVGTSEGLFQPEDLRAVVRDRATLVATTSDGVRCDLLLQVSGYSFSALAEDAKTVVAQGVPIRVGQLSKLLHSKRTAGRPKDQQFLKRYAASLASPVPKTRHRKA